MYLWAARIDIDSAFPPPFHQKSYDLFSPCARPLPLLDLLGLFVFEFEDCDVDRMSADTVPPVVWMATIAAGLQYTACRPKPTRANETHYADFKVLSHPQRSLKKYLFGIIDAHDNYMWLFPVKSPSTETVIRTRKLDGRDQGGAAQRDRRPPPPRRQRRRRRHQQVRRPPRPRVPGSRTRGLRSRQGGRARHRTRARPGARPAHARRGQQRRRRRQ